AFYQAMRTTHFREVRRVGSILFGRDLACAEGELAMSGVSVDRLLILVAVVLVVSGGWPKSGLNVAAATSDPATVTPLAPTPSTEPASDQRSSAALTLIAASAKLDEAKPS